jgi:hypothetical protein
MNARARRTNARDAASRSTSRSTSTSFDVRVRVRVRAARASAERSPSTRRARSNGAIETRRGKQRTRGVDADETRRREDARGADARDDDGAITRSREKIMCV